MSGKVKEIEFEDYTVYSKSVVLTILSRKYSLDTVFTDEDLVHIKGYNVLFNLEDLQAELSRLNFTYYSATLLNAGIAFKLELKKIGAKYYLKISAKDKETRKKVSLIQNEGAPFVSESLEICDYRGISKVLESWYNDFMVRSYCDVVRLGKLH